MGWKSKWGLDKCIENIVKDLEKKYSKKENLS
jgi:hypothetical protein